MKDLLNDDIRAILRKENNFDFIRYFLAFSVITFHFCVLCQTDDYSPLPWRTCLYSFFVLSGFLVFHSYIRTPSIKEYAFKRLRRIYPAYFLTIVFCFLLGFFMTSLPLSEYIRSSEIYTYLATNLVFINFIQTNLPGVFENNFSDIVNGSLWTVRVELIFYATIPFFYYLMIRFNKLLILLGILVFSIGYSHALDYLFLTTDNVIFYLLRKQLIGQVSYFFMGTFILCYLDYFQRYIKIILPVSLAAYIISSNFDIFILSAIEPITLSCIIIGLAYNFKYLNFIGRYPNISYGMYLFHFPVIQIVLYYNVQAISPLLAFITSMIITLIIASLSWKFVESPILKVGRPLWRPRPSKSE